MIFSLKPLPAISIELLRAKLGKRA
jgi:hypothetical protein